MLALPWALKFLWAPVVDRYALPRVGRRTSWIVPLQLLTAAPLLAVAGWPPSRSLTPLLVTVFVVNLLAATQDIATDGLAVELLAPSERGLANGVQVGGYRLGMILGGGVLLAFGLVPRPLVDSRFAASDDVFHLRQVRISDQHVEP